MTRTDTTPLHFHDRVLLCITDLALTEERNSAEHAFTGLTDSDVLAAIESWTLGSCATLGDDDAYCKHTEAPCCDYAALGRPVWAFVEEALSSE